MDFDFESQIMELVNTHVKSDEQAYFVLGSLFLQAGEDTVKSAWAAIINAFGIKSIKSIRTVNRSTVRFDF